MYQQVPKTASSDTLRYASLSTQYAQKLSEAIPEKNITELTQEDINLAKNLFIANAVHDGLYAAKVFLNVVEENLGKNFLEEFFHTLHLEAGPGRSINMSFWQDLIYYKDINPKYMHEI